MIARAGEAGDVGTEIDVSDFSLGSRLRTTAHDTGMATWARLSPDLGSRKASDAAYAVGHALSDAMDVLKAAVLLTVAAELDRISPELTSAVCSKTDEW